ncbi:Fic/DOC family protein [Sphingopyxis sp.]|jgi:cell filamentation protein|uniref:Fic/DOC family protein n=1 Tax=Sphingopyxis sp. TaxID=1908224 RepID=UPI003F6F7372
MAYAAEDDPYCYPGTTVLRNLLGIQDGVTLETVETELTTARADEPLPEGSLDVAHFRAIHYHLFQDLYDWAGQTRTVRTSKGSSHFCYPEYIDAELGKLFASLSDANFFTGMKTAEYAVAAAEFLATLNVIHAFREGNGRVQLSFLLLLSEAAGHPLQLERLNPEAMLAAMVASFNGDEHPLADILLGLASTAS